MKEQSSLGQWLGEKCHREHLSLRQAAARTGLTHTTIDGILKGGHPTPETIRKLAQGFGGNGELRLALEDHLLVLAGYRSERLTESLSRPLAQLMDKVGNFNESQLKMMEHFADFLIRIEKEGGGARDNISLLDALNLGSKWAPILGDKKATKRRQTKKDRMSPKGTLASNHGFGN